MAKHYIRINENNEIIKSFSTDFEQPEQDDICVNEDGDRHYNLAIRTDDMQYRLKYIANEIIEKTEEELILPPLTESEQALIDLSNSDNSMIRCIDDILDYIVNDTPIPKEAKDKLANRKILRTKI